MPRPKKIGGPEPKKRSRNGCWPCKAKKVKCGEEKPSCLNCQRQGEPCDYSIRLNWDGRTKRKAGSGTPEPLFVLHGSLALDPPAAMPVPLSFTTSNRQDSATAINILHGSANSGVLETQGRSTDGSPKPYSDHAALALRNASTASSANYTTSTISPYAAMENPAPSGPGYDRKTSSSNSNSSNDADVLEDEPARTGPRSQIELPTPPIGRSAAHISRPADLGLSSMLLTPEKSSLDSPGLNNQFISDPTASLQHTSMTPMLPPHHIPPHTSPSNSRKDRNYILSPENMTKKIRLSPLLGFSQSAGVADAHSYNTSSFSTQSIQMKSVAPAPPSSPFDTNIGTPLTLRSSSAASEDIHQRLSSLQANYQSPDIRRLSVSSLLSSPSDGVHPIAHAEQSSQILPYPVSNIGTDTVTYGLDRGFPDLDVSKNDDTNALNGMPPAMVNTDMEEVVQDHSGDDPYVPTEFGFGLQAKNTVFGKGGYYAKPVPVQIPKILEPLPATLLQNPMNLLYFHHFLNHTARILVPHDCSENPFRKILPQMALENVHLLNLLLAYSASHRARLLNQPEPANRIALWVQDVFPALRLALDDSKEKISNVNLATAIMLASLEIISPNTFEVPVPWQNHLNTARRMIIARGGAQSVHRQDKISYFLSRWFAYLDVLGSLSGSKNDRPLFGGNYWAHDSTSDTDENDFQIDCLLGFTSRCVSILAKIAELARQCDSERIDANGHIRKAWTPSPATVAAADQLQRDLQDARTHVYQGCPHRHPHVQSQSHSHSESEEGWDSLEMVATNDAFHWAGLVHLHRRVLGKPSSDPQVQNAVREIVGALYKVRKGGTAEACLLFPMFTAGCDAREQSGQREKIMERIRSVEGFGMTQVRKARTLMQRVWDTGKPWETLVTGEFFG